MHFSSDFLPAFQPSSGRKPTRLPVIQQTHIIPERSPSYSIFKYWESSDDESTTLGGWLGMLHINSGGNRTRKKGRCSCGRRRTYGQGQLVQETGLLFVY